MLLLAYRPTDFVRKENLLLANRTQPMQLVAVSL